jgi:hypothetical protein
MAIGCPAVDHTVIAKTVDAIHLFVDSDMHDFYSFWFHIVSIAPIFNAYASFPPGAPAVQMPVQALS